MTDRPACLSWLTRPTQHIIPLPSAASPAVPSASPDLPTFAPSTSTPSPDRDVKVCRPPLSLAVLIYEAFHTLRSQLTVADIAGFICNKYDYYKTRKYWTITGTVRNALTKDRRFTRLPKDACKGKRASFWMLANPQLWREVVDGTAPLIRNEASFRSEVKRRSSAEARIPIDQLVSDPDFLPSPTTELPELGPIDFSALESPAEGLGLDPFVETKCHDLDKHPWAEDLDWDRDWVF